MDMRKYDITPINKIVLDDGINLGWKKLLATHITKNSEKFSYILNNSVFDEVEVLKEDYLKELTVANVGVLYEYSLALSNCASRKALGQFFTPDDIATIIAQKAIEIGKNGANGVWLDPCSGVGNLSYTLASLQEEPEVFVKNNILLSDLDPLALLIARVLITLSFQKNDKNLFNNIEQNFIVFDFLKDKPLSDSKNKKLDSIQSKIENKLSLNSSHFSKENDIETLTTFPKKYDYIIMNPPYVSGVSVNGFTTSKCGDYYAYFMENAIRHTKGFVSITPQSFTHAKKFSPLRKLMLDNCSKIKLYNFDNIPDNIFSGVKFGSTNSNAVNSIRPTITIAINGGSCESFQTTGLLRWRTVERSNFLAKIDDFVTEPIDVSFDALFPKISKGYENILKSFETSTMNVGNLFSTKPTDFVLYVPSSPRYFISAVKRPLSRSSIKVLYFNSEKDRNIASLLLNSSFAYWWWRVYDGGMTLSLETIKSIPVPDWLDVSEEIFVNLLKKLDFSDTDDVVFKMNAGKPQENVKRSPALVLDITKAIFPDYFLLLSSTHLNSVITTTIKDTNNGSEKEQEAEC